MRFLASILSGLSSFTSNKSFLMTYWFIYSEPEAPKSIIES